MGTETKMAASGTAPSQQTYDDAHDKSTHSCFTVCVCVSLSLSLFSVCDLVVYLLVMKHAVQKCLQRGL